MRPIKFRLWDKTVNKMIFDFLLNPDGEAHDYDRDGWYPWDTDYILMQYTGLKDKNGVEIYEGDIVIHNLWHDRTETRIVEWNNEGTGYDPFAFWSGGMCPTLPDMIEVIGNVWEHPELLEKPHE